MKMTWKQCLMICGLLLACDKVLCGAEPHKPMGNANRQVIAGKVYTSAAIRALANRTDRELANLKPLDRMPPVARKMSKAAWAVSHARPDPHPESADWLTIATR